MSGPHPLASAAAPLSPRPDGELDCGGPVVLPLMAPRLQGTFDSKGRLELSLWGAGALGVLGFTPLTGPMIVGPNRLRATGGALHVATSAPVVLIEGVRYRRFRAAPACAPWGARIAPTPVKAQGLRRDVDLPWGHVRIETRGADLVIACGATPAEAETALQLDNAQIRAEAFEHIAACDRLPAADPVLRSLVLFGYHAQVSAVRRDAQGDFAGLAAGLAYSAPARTYFRDAYWTLQGLLTAAPHIVRAQINLLAVGIHADGEAPSAVVLTGPETGAWYLACASNPVLAAAHPTQGEWWPDHFDSPLFFILTVADYVAATGEKDCAREHWPAMVAILDRYKGFCRPGEALPLKPRHDRDWADNVFREGYVAYDLGLWIGALDALTRLGSDIDPRRAGEAEKLAATARENLENALWREPGGYADYVTPGGFVEHHLTLDSLTLLRYDAAPPARANAVLSEVRDRLEARHLAAQPWGDWGVACAYPPYGRRADLRAKTAFAWRYHNGGDWPWLDGLYADERLRRGLSGWRYPLTRWWEYSLAQGWAGPVEYFSPAFGRGSLLQGWSGFPAAVAVANARTVLAGDPEADHLPMIAET